MNFRILIAFSVFVLASCASKEPPTPSTPENPSRIMLTDTFQGEEYVVYANARFGTMQAFSTTASDGTRFQFERLAGAFPTVMRDQEGNEWNIYGVATKGPRLGQQLRVMNGMMGFWFSFAAMYQEVTRYGEEEKISKPLVSPDPDWLIDPNRVYFGSFKDGIKSIDQPEFELFQTNVKNDNYIRNEDLVITFFDGNQIRVYPHKVLDWHEVVNDGQATTPAAISYCPLTGTASVWESTIDGQLHSFGVSGLLYNSNLILYDRTSDSNWQQMRQLAVSGPYMQRVPEIIPYAEMTWEGARKLDSELVVMTENTGEDRNYDEYPYGEYRTNNEQINYPLDVFDQRIPAKERVLAVIINDHVKVYRFSDFE